MLGLLACGGAARKGDSSGAVSGGAAGTSTAGNTGTGLAGAGGLAQMGEAGAPMSSPAGAAGDTQLPHLPGGSAEEEQLIAPLFSDASVAAGNLDALVDLAIEVGLARGYAMCRCFRTPMAPPDNVNELVARCARDEAGVFRHLAWFPSPERAPLPNRDMLQCLKNRGASPELTQALLCQIQQFQQDGRGWVDWCLADQSMPHPSTPPSCDAEAWTTAHTACLLVTYCADGAEVRGSRCDARTDCDDGSDEQSCFEIEGNDNFVCGGGVIPAWSLCSDECSLALQPPVCDPERQNDFKCADGNYVGQELLCNRAKDCPDGSDEASCLR